MSEHEEQAIDITTTEDSNRMYLLPNGTVVKGDPLYTKELDVDKLAYYAATSVPLL